MNKKSALMIVFIAIICNNTFSWETGNDLIKFWKEYKSEKSNYSTGMYMGYITGCLDTINIVNYVMTETDYGGGDLGFELDSYVTLGQICSVIGKWLDNNPEKWNLPGNILVVQALQEAFPKAK